MYEATKVITNDGKMFDTGKEAKNYLDKQYTNLVCRVSSQLLSISNYQQMKIFIDENCELFKEMLSLKRELDEGIRN